MRISNAASMLLSSGFALCPMAAHANCFRINAGALNRTNASDFIAEVLTKIDYSACTAAELTVAMEGTRVFGASQALKIASDDWATKSSAMAHVSLVKSSLALMQQELAKKK